MTGSGRNGIFDMTEKKQRHAASAAIITRYVMNEEGLRDTAFCPLFEAGRHEAGRTGAV